MKNSKYTELINGISGIMDNYSFSLLNYKKIGSLISNDVSKYLYGKIEFDSIIDITNDIDIDNGVYNLGIKVGDNVYGIGEYFNIMITDDKINDILNVNENKQ